MKLVSLSLFLERCQNPHFWTPVRGIIQDWRKNETCQKNRSKEAIVFRGGCQNLIFGGGWSKPPVLDPRKGCHPGWLAHFSNYSCTPTLCSTFLKSSRIGKNETCQKDCSEEAIVFGGGSKPPFLEGVKPPFLDPRKGGHPGLEEKP